MIISRFCYNGAGLLFKYFIQEDSRRFKKNLEDSRRFKKIQEDSRRFKKIQEYSRNDKSYMKLQEVA